MRKAGSLVVFADDAGSRHSRAYAASRYPPPDSRSFRGGTDAADISRATCGLRGDDLYLSSAGRCPIGRVVAVESHPTATADLAANLAAAGLSNVEIETARAESDRHWDTMRRIAPQGVVLEPPSKGLPPRYARYVAGIGADRIVVLQEGRVAEMGSHDALVAQGGLYAQMHALQAPTTGGRDALRADAPA